jgi:hypothetical protein
VNNNVHSPVITKAKTGTLSGLCCWAMMLRRLIVVSVFSIYSIFKLCQVYQDITLNTIWGSSVHSSSVSPPYLWISYKCGKKIINKSTEILKEKFKLLCIHSATPSRETQSVLCCCHLCLNSCVICWVFPCPYLCKSIPPKNQMVPKKEGKKQVNVLNW